MALGVEKEYLTSKKSFIFKTHSFLRIKTDDGRRYFSEEYLFSDKFVVLNRKTPYFLKIFLGYKDVFMAAKKGSLEEQ